MGAGVGGERTYFERLFIYVRSLRRGTGGVLIKFLYTEDKGGLVTNESR